jgi:hypothetical protein
MEREYVESYGSHEKQTHKTSDQHEEYKVSLSFQ